MYTFILLLSFFNTCYASNNLKILNHTLANDLESLSQARGRESANEFRFDIKNIEYDTSLSKMWLVVQFQALITNPEEQGETILQLGNSLPLRPNLSAIIFKSNDMTDYDKSHDSMLEWTDGHVNFVEADPSRAGYYYQTHRYSIKQAKYYADESKKLQLEKINQISVETGKPKPKLVQKTVLVEFPTDSKAWKDAYSVNFYPSISESKNMKALSLEFIFGEGDLPPELELAISQESKGWFNENKKVILFSLMVGLTLLLRKIFN